MGNCSGSPVANPSPTASGQLSSGSTSDEPFNEGQILASSNLRVFTMSELKLATENFQADRLLGANEFGEVYKGRIGEMVVAVKKFSASSLNRFEDWESEVSFLGRLSHPNLVKLFGYCWEQEDLIWVYEYIPKGSLEAHLFGRGSSVPPLSWDLRLKIAIGAAKGLSFLNTAKQVIYKDFKTSNILLDASYNAKLSDFGLARASRYAAPDLLSTGNLYVKNDVYGFGVVMVEILTGLRAFDTNRPSEQFSLVNWVTPFLLDRRKLRKIMDPRLKGKYPLEAALQTAHLALKCLALDPNTRPSMEQIVETLTEIKSISEKPTEPRDVPFHKNLMKFLS